MIITVLNTKINEVTNKIPDTSSLVTTTLLNNTKVSEGGNKIPSDSVGKYFAAPDYSKFRSDLRDVKIKQKELFNKSEQLIKSE